MKPTIEYYRAADAAPLVMVIDPQGRIITVNTTFESVIAIDGNEVKGRPPWEVLPTVDDRESLQRAFAAMLAGEEGVRVSHQLPIHGNTGFRLTWSGTPVLVDGELTQMVVTAPGFQAIHIHADDQLRLHRAVNMASLVDDAITSSQDEKTLLERVCNIIIGTQGYRLAWVGMAEHDAAKTVRPVAQAGDEEGYLETVTITWDDSPTGQGPTGTAIRTRKAVVASNIGQDPNMAPWRRAALLRGYRSSMALPLFIDATRVMGALNVYSDEVDAFGDGEVTTLSVMADRLSEAVVHLRGG